MSEDTAVVSVNEDTGEVLTAQSELPVTSMQPYHPVSIAHVMSDVNVVAELKKHMKKDTDYGVIPGCKKPSLYQPGAIKLTNLFGCGVFIDTEVFDLPNFHREYRSTATLIHLATGKEIGRSMGSCSTLEGKYRWRNQERTCPICGQQAIIKGKTEYGGGWVCFKKKGGCGNKWSDGEKLIEAQDVGKIENPDIADQWNTCLKMSEKRAYTGVTLKRIPGVSDLFTQDLEPKDGDSPQTPPDTPNPVYEPQQGDPFTDIIPEPTVNFRDRIGKMLMVMANDDKDIAMDSLAGFTSFTNKDGEEVKGKRSLKALTAKQLKPTYGKIKPVYLEYCEKHGIEDNICGKE